VSAPPATTGRAATGADTATLRFVRDVAGRYPARTALLAVLLFLAGLAEGVGVAVLLPMLETAFGDAGEPRSALSSFAAGWVVRFGLPLRLETLLALICLAMLLKGAFRLLAMRQVGYTAARVGADLREELVESLLRARWSYFVGQPIGRFANAVGAEALRAAVAYRFVCVLFGALIQVLVYTALALWISWTLTLLALAAGAVIWLLRAPLVRRSHAASRTQTRLLRRLSAGLADVFGGIKPVKAMDRDRHLGSLFRREIDEFREAQQRQVVAVEAVAATREPLLVVLVAIALYVIVTTTTQPLPAVLVLAFLFSRIAGQVGQAQSHYQDVAVGEAAYASIREAIGEAQAGREPREGRRPPPPLRDGVEFRDVGFRYDGRPVLDGVSFEIPAGRFVALVGPSGAGKTTIADLIAGLLAPTSGELRIDGVPLAEVDLGAWRRGIGYVPQDALLLHASVLDNVVLGDPAPTRRDVENALEAAGALGFVRQLADGIDTVIGERGARLSGGQRQRIALARALVGSPRLLILDEATASLDPATEGEIVDTLRRLRGTMTILAISHQPAMMAVADLVFRVEGASVVGLAAPAAAEASHP
jgi:ATP-binding cassette, subfamily C, bacterial